MCMHDIISMCLQMQEKDAWFVAMCETVIVGSLEKVCIYLGTLVDFHFL